MKKFIALIFLITCFSLGQTNPILFKQKANSQYAASLNGTSQYASLTPVAGSMDLNESEQILNGGMENFTAGVATQFSTASDGTKGTYSQETTIKHSGSSSQKVDFTGATGTWQIIATFGNINILNGQKCTTELWVYGTAGKRITLDLRNVNTLIYIKTYTIVASNTWEKIVFNQLNSSGVTITKTVISFLDFAANEVYYIDDCSLTPAHDVIYLGALKTNSLGAEQYVLSSASTNYLSVRSLITSGTIRSAISDGTTTVVFSGGSLTPNSWAYVAITYLRDGNGTQYLNSAQIGTPASIAGIGKLIGLTPLQIGASSGAITWNGLEGEFQIIRGVFTPDQAASIVSAYFTTKKCLRSYPNQISGGIWIDWKTPIDKFGIQGALTNVGGAPIVRYRP